MNGTLEQQLQLPPRGSANSRKRISSKKVALKKLDAGKDIEAPVDTEIDETDFEEFSLSEAKRNFDRQESITILKVTQGDAVVRQLAVNSNFGRMNSNRREKSAYKSEVFFKAQE